MVTLSLNFIMLKVTLHVIDNQGCVSPKSPGFTSCLSNAGSNFSAKISPTKQISHRSGPSLARATFFCGSEMDANINSFSKKLPLPAHGRLEKQNFLLPSHLKFEIYGGIWI